MNAPAVLTAGRRRPVTVRGIALCSCALGAATLLLTACPTRVAQAELAACRSDPVVELSNGVSLDLSATIADDAADVRQTLYTLHAPAGTRVVAVLGTDGLLGLTERFAFVADAPANTYTTQTVVDTGAAGVSVTASTTVVRAGASVAATRAGVSHQVLPLTVAP